VTGLMLIAAIPLSGTGLRSGSLAAALLDMRFKWTSPAVIVGLISSYFSNDIE